MAMIGKEITLRMKVRPLQTRIQVVRLGSRDEQKWFPFTIVPTIYRLIKKKISQNDA